MVVLTVAALALSACGRQAEPVVAPGTERLGTAITSVATARSALLGAQERLVAGATALDDLDEAAAAGERKAATTARDQVDEAAPAARTALGEMPDLLTAYETAVTELTAAGEGAVQLDRAQRGLVLAVGETARTEIAASERLRTTGNGAFASYGRMERAARTWLERATRGWYRTTSESAAAYAVLLGDTRDRLDQARQALVRADTSRRAASGQVSTALREADAALEPLRPRSPTP